MSKMNDVLIQAEENLTNDERLAKWRREYEKMQKLAEQWDGVYKKIPNTVGEVRKK